MRNIKYIIIHCTAASGDQPTQNVLDYWRRVKGWRNPGYHWLIGDNGLAVRLAPDIYITNGVGGYNGRAINICYKGGWNKKDTRTPIQKEALLVLIQDYKKLYPAAQVVGHRDLSPDLNGNGIIEQHEWIKDCPCFDAKKEYAHL